MFLGDREATAEGQASELSVEEVEKSTAESQSSTGADEQSAQSFDEETRRILGIDTQPEAPKLQLHASLAENWTKWIAEGLKKDDHAELLAKYSRTGNCNLEAPKLNPEVAASLFETAVKRDKYLMNAQNIRGSAMAALGTGISLLLTPNEDGVDEYKLLECFADAGRLLACAHRLDTISRKAIIVPSLDKKVKAILDDTKSDVFLFGDNLTEKLKAAKIIEKTSLELKPATQKQPQQGNSSGNWKGPPAKTNRGGSQAGYSQGATRKVVRFTQRPATQARQGDQDRDRSRPRSQTRTSSFPRGGPRRH